MHLAKAPTVNFRPLTFVEQPNHQYVEFLPDYKYLLSIIRLCANN